MSRAAAEAVVAEWVRSVAEDGLEVGHASGIRLGEHVLVLPGEQKLQTTVSVLVGRRSVSASAFVVRRADENHEAVYRFLLQRNLRLPGVAYGVDSVGDVYVSGSVPAAGLTVETFDDLVGAILQASDGVFNKVLELGFASAIRKEWQWRVDRGEPTDNLRVFRHLFDDSDGGSFGGE